jgi:transposase
MGRRSRPYPQAFRQQMLELIKAGKTAKELSVEFGCCKETINHWVAQDAIDEGKPLSGKTGLTSVEREELARLRRENRQLKMERDILAKATAWFAGKGEKMFTPSSS